MSMKKIINFYSRSKPQSKSLSGCDQIDLMKIYRKPSCPTHYSQAERLQYIKQTKEKIGINSFLDRIRKKSVRGPNRYIKHSFFEFNSFPPKVYQKVHSIEDMAWMGEDIYWKNLEIHHRTIDSLKLADEHTQRDVEEINSAFHNDEKI